MEGYRPRYLRVAMAFGIPRKFVLTAFGLGAFSGMFALLANSFYGMNAAILVRFDTTWTILLLVCVVAPLVEELVKPFGLYMIEQEEQPDLSVRDWAVLGAFAGLGFATVENLLYGFGVAYLGGEAFLLLVAMRYGLPLHIISTSIAGAGYGMWTMTRDPMYFVRYIAVSMALHGAFNLTMVML